MKAPPISGPQTDATPYILPRRAVYFPRLRNGTLKAMMIKLPAKIPAEPSPEIALPTIEAVEFGEIPPMKEPSSKMQIEERYAHLRLKKVKKRPQSSWQEQVVRN